MTATTKQEFLRAGIDTALTSYPVMAQYVQAGDPRIMAMLGAMATMLGMHSAQVDAAQFEPFSKVRDSTVLADASLKGILPLGRACRVRIKVENNGTEDYVLQAGRRFQDPKGRIFQVVAPVTIVPGGFALVEFSQTTLRTITHTVSQPTTFYGIEVTQTDDDVYLDSLSVWLGGQEFSYAPDWFNVKAGDYAYQVETDERRRMWVRFGSTNVVGYGVQSGDTFELRVGECEGRITDLEPATRLTPEYIYTSADGQITATLDGVIDEGAGAPTMSELRVMARYPALYDVNAVYLAEFDLLLRRHLSGVRFLSVWNEQIEESVRGASVANINTLFVAGSVTGMTDAQFQDRVRQLIARADDSYKVQFKARAETAIPVTISGKVAMVHDAAAVQAQVRALVLSTFGDGAPAVSQGGALGIRHQALSRLLRDKIAAFGDDLSDFSITITAPTTMLPEMHMIVTEASLTVNITRADFGNGLWNH